jgi:RND family efflux transporter MFP subunit
LFRHAVWASLACFIGTAAAAETSLNLSADQLRIAGVEFARAAAPDSSAGASLQLTGRVVVPNGELQLVLAQTGGRVESLLVNPGQAVRAGQALARLYSAEILATQRELIAARARSQAAGQRAARDEALHAEGIIARNRLEESQAMLAEADAELREAQQLLRLAGMSTDALDAIRTAEDISPLLVLTARRPGKVLQQLVSPGEAVAAGTPLLRLATLDVLWIELQATRAAALGIHEGDQVQVDGCDQVARVIASALQVDAQSQTIGVRAEMRNPAGCIAPNQFVEARVAPRSAQPGLVQIPAAGLVQHEGRNYVFVRAAGGLQPRVVSVERRTGDTAWIADGLAIGEEVASAGLAAIKGSWLGLGAAETP